jgi:aminoglycoside phosphotransferase (APT) family kinase protein
MRVAESAQIKDADILSTLSTSLADQELEPTSLALLSRQPSVYASSHRLEEIKVRLPSGSVLSLLLKVLGAGGLSEVGRKAKPVHLYDARREMAVYQRVLGPHGVDSARLYGCREGYETAPWVLLEHVDGAELYQIGDLAIWQTVARWAAALHRRFPPPEIDSHVRNRLLLVDRNYLLQWPHRALSMISGRISMARRSALMRLSQSYAEAVDALLEYPSSLMHGEFYASNILVGKQSDRSPRVVPVDWEMAAVGPGVLDLAALTSGHWEPGERERIVSAYADGASWGNQHDIARGLKLAQLHQSWQWLGWSTNWTPPASQAQDWLSQTLQLGNELGLI